MGKKIAAMRLSPVFCYLDKDNLERILKLLRKIERRGCLVIVVALLTVLILLKKRHWFW